MGKKLSKHSTWVGKTDWQLAHFHGDEYSTHLGSSYNSFLVRDKKTALIDTVWLPFDKEFVTRLKEEIDLKEIDYIVMNHNEVDHSGALPELMREIPEVPIYCTSKGEQILHGHYHQDWNYVNVRTGDTLTLGDTTLTFIEATMLHWPDTMMTHLSSDNVLFSNDVFGQHFASESLFDDSVDAEKMMDEAMKYYANILLPYSNMAKKKLAELKTLDLPIEIIAPSHGVIWQKRVGEILDRYEQWSQSYQENRIVIIYDTMWNSTRIMAENIALGIYETDPGVTVKLLNASVHDKNDILTEIFRAKAIAVGCPTINNRLSHAMGGLLEMIKGLRFNSKKGIAFGSYGWSGESVGIINSMFKASGFDVIDDGLKIQWVPDVDAIRKCIHYGTALANATKL